MNIHSDTRITIADSAEHLHRLMQKMIKEKSIFACKGGVYCLDKRTVTIPKAIRKLLCSVPCLFIDADEPSAWTVNHGVTVESICMKCKKNKCQYKIPELINHFSTDSLGSLSVLACCPVCSYYQIIAIHPQVMSLDFYLKVMCFTDSSELYKNCMLVLKRFYYRKLYGCRFDRAEVKSLSVLFLTSSRKSSRNLGLELYRLANEKETVFRRAVKWFET